MALLKKLAFILFFFIVTEANAQNFFPEQTDYAFQITADYDLPGNSLKGIYKPGTSFNLTFLKYNTEKFTIGGTLGYREFGAKMPDYTETDQLTGSVMTSTTSPYVSYILYVTGMYNIELNEKNRIYGGLNIGSYFTNYSFTYRDDNTNISEANSERQAYFAPKIGAAFGLANNLDLDIHAAFNIFSENYEYNSRTGSQGTLYTSISAGIGLAFKF